MDLEMMKRVIHYIKTTDFSDPNLEYCEEQHYIEEEHLQNLIDKDTQIAFYKNKMIELGGAEELAEFEAELLRKREQADKKNREQLIRNQIEVDKRNKIYLNYIRNLKKRRIND